MINLPDGSAVLDYLGDAGSGISEATAERCVRRATALVRAHTSGRGFSPRGDAVASDLSKVILMSAGRALTNPAYLLSTGEEPITAGPEGHSE